MSKKVLLAFLILFLWSMILTTTNNLHKWLSYHSNQENTSDNKNDTSIEKESNGMNNNHHSIANHDCFPHNSPEWLQGHRLGNIDDEDNQLLRHVLEWWKKRGNKKAITQHSICLSESQFNSPNAPFAGERQHVDNENTKDIDLFRLLYEILYHHHYKSAIYEINHRILRKVDSCAAFGVGNHDFECPRAKFLVTPIPNYPVGFGAAYRICIVRIILYSLALGRIPILLHHNSLHRLFRYSFLGILLNSTAEPAVPPLFSCQRHDYQCTFLPLSPCVITRQDIETAGMVFPSFDPTFILSQEKNATTRNERIWIMPMMPMMSGWLTNDPFLHQLLPNKLFEILSDMYGPSSSPLLSAANETRSQEYGYYQQLLNQSLSRNMSFDRNGVSGHQVHGGRWNPIIHATLLYTLRPRPAVQQQSNKLVARALHPARNKTSHQMGSSVVGLMVRNSDKCGTESTCLNRTEYMALLQYVNATDVILTSEDYRVLWSLGKQSSTPPTAEGQPRFFWNQQDTSQKSGNTREWQSQADQVMLSSIVSLKLQLHSHVTYANCCSNFHNMLFDLAQHGCGATTSPRERHLVCLQEFPKPEFRICCLQHTSPACRARTMQLQHRYNMRATLPRQLSRNKTST